MESRPNVPVEFHLFGTTWWDKFGMGIWFAQKRHIPMHVGGFFVMEDHTRVGFHAQNELPGNRLGGFVQFDFDRYRAAFRTWHHILRGKTIRTMRVPLSVSELEAKWDKCMSMTREVKGYAHTQILAKLAHEAKGYPMPEDPDYVDCSEGMGMVMAYKTPQYDLRNEVNKNFDSFTPYELWRGSKRRIKGRK